ncbi:MAG: catechol 2,3-dioxygenase-like lactoylglutathione lyase family enzyme [Chitinophagales bacterium]|jgi:catechol 2,3-dioxygenase-like lactoylglutathione lyase family enzyme
MKINELKIYSSNLDQQVEFYSSTLGLELIKRTPVEAKIQIGKSILTLLKNKQSLPYHFAINIPSNMETEALEWLKERVVILKDGQHEIQDFDFWNAKAIYFYDKDKNIVELIARKNLNNQLDGAFNSECLLEISEIGMPVNNIEPIYLSLKATTGIPIFSGDIERFCAIGNEQGLFICIDKQLKDWFPTGEKAHSADFEISFQESDKNFHLDFKDENISLTKI